MAVGVGVPSQSVDELKLACFQRIAGEKYELLRLLGSGGMGVVFEARHRVMGNRVAIKFLHVGEPRSEVARGRFLREARATANLHSDHIVRTLDFGQGADGSPFLVMDLLQGVTLRELIDQGSLTLGRSLSLMRDVCRGVSLAHAAGIVHRDLKPANLFVVRQGERELCKVLDFGLAKRLGEGTLTDERGLLGTVQYMAPEQVTGDEPVDAKSDVFALGAIFFEMLTGRRPHDEAEPRATVYRIVERDAPRVEAFNPQVPVALCELVGRALQRDRALRHSGAAALLTELEAIELPNDTEGSIAALPAPSVPLSVDTASHGRSPWAFEGLSASGRGGLGARSLGLALAVGGLALATWLVLPSSGSSAPSSAAPAARGAGGSSAAPSKPSPDVSQAQLPLRGNPKSVFGSASVVRLDPPPVGIEVTSTSEPQPSRAEGSGEAETRQVSKARQVSEPRRPPRVAPASGAAQLALEAAPSRAPARVPGGSSTPTALPLIPKYDSHNPYRMERAHNTVSAPDR